MWLTLAAQILKWLLPLLPQLSGQLDADAQRHYDEYHQRRTKLEADEKQAEIELGAIESRVHQLQGERDFAQEEAKELENHIVALNEQIRRNEDEKNKNLDRIRNAVDDDVLRGDLFAAGSGSGNPKAAN